VFSGKSSLTLLRLHLSFGERTARTVSPPPTPSSLAASSASGNDRRVRRLHEGRTKIVEPAIRDEPDDGIVERLRLCRRDRDRTTTLWRTAWILSRKHSSVGPASKMST
jgi:hypothetical protein